MEYDLYQTNKKGLQQIEILEGQVISEVEERIRVEGEIVLKRRDMILKKRDTEKQTRQLSLDRAVDTSVSALSKIRSKIGILIYSSSIK